MLKLNGFEIKPTIFPDKTSQVWKLPDEALKQQKDPDDPNGRIHTYEWKFENEAELFHLAQLVLLVQRNDYKKKRPSAHHSLFIRTLPYARQDKRVANDATFALEPFAYFLNNIGFDAVHVVDPHNYKLTNKLIRNLHIWRPEEKIRHLLRDLSADPCFPDAGARQRYGDHLLYNLDAYPPVTFDKERDQLTGNITGMKLSEGVIHKDRPYLIIDDLCDGGWTFTKCAGELYAAGAGDVALYVSHGIFSKGLTPLRDAGIKRIFTYDGETA